MFKSFSQNPIRTFEKVEKLRFYLIFYPNSAKAPVHCLRAKPFFCDTQRPPILLLNAPSQRFLFFITSVWNWKGKPSRRCSSYSCEACSRAWPLVGKSFVGGMEEKREGEGGREGGREREINITWRTTAE